MARKLEVLPPTTPLLCDHITYRSYPINKTGYPFFGPPCRRACLTCQSFVNSRRIGEQIEGLKLRFIYWSSVELNRCIGWMVWPPRSHFPPCWPSYIMAKQQTCCDDVLLSIECTSRTVSSVLTAAIVVRRADTEWRFGTAACSDLVPSTTVIVGVNICRLCSTVPFLSATVGCQLHYIH